MDACKFMLHSYPFSSTSHLSKRYYMYYKEFIVVYRRYYTIRSRTYIYMYIHTHAHTSTPTYVSCNAKHHIGIGIYTLTLQPKVRSLRQRGAVEGPERSPEQLNVHFKIRILLYVTQTHFNVPGTLLGFRHLINTFQNNSRTLKIVFQKPVKSTGRTISIDRSIHLKFSNFLKIDWSDHLNRPV